MFLIALVLPVFFKRVYDCLPCSLSFYRPGSIDLSLASRCETFVPIHPFEFLIQEDRATGIVLHDPERCLPPDQGTATHQR